MRIYRVWAGSEKGTREDPARCIVSVPDGVRSPLSHQCYRKRGHGEGGLLCGQHAKQQKAGAYLSIPKDQP